MSEEAVESLTKPRILVVEDEPSILDNVLYALRSEGFSAEGCPTAGDAHNHLEGERWDLLVLDVGLPDMSGFDLCKKIRETSATPIIFLTARGGEVDRIVGLEIGADDYVVKPFSPRELAARAKAVLRRFHANPPAPASPAPEELSPEPALATPFVIDPARARITYFDQPLDLSSTEFRLLCALCRKPGRVYSRAQLMDIAWDDPGAALERTVDAHVKSLRSKLRGVHEGTDAIVTHRGFGYALREDW